MIYRSLTALPDPRIIPNIEFTIDATDRAQVSPFPSERTIWSWARNKSDEHPWVIPDFDGWSYPDDSIGGYAAFRETVQGIDKPWGEKIKKALWRGSTSLHPVDEPQLRTRLLKVAKGKAWSDVKPLDWDTGKNVVPMHEHCNWQYLIHTEGITKDP
jgi:hypothetical protein